jgi:hypothetical protein
MEDEGHLDDHTSGISATDGAWHHIALTWQSSDGRATLYDNARKVRLHVSAFGHSFRKMCVNYLSLTRLLSINAF